MDAYILETIQTIQKGSSPLTLTQREIPIPKSDEVRIKVECCGLCHTDLDIIEGRTPPSELPMILGHQLIGHIDEIGQNVTEFKRGDRVGVGWIASACGTCSYCKSDRENLCSEFKATGRDISGGYAQYCVAKVQYIIPIPDDITSTNAAPLFCAGAIGYRSILLSGLEDHQHCGLMGFGACGHLMIQQIRHLYPHTTISVFARNPQVYDLATSLGAKWCGDITDTPPEPLDVIIETTPAWTPIVEALNNLKPGGRLVINAIRKLSTDKDYLQKITYKDHLWMEKEVKSIANITKKDIQDFIQLCTTMPLKTTTQTYPFSELNTGIEDLKFDTALGAKVCTIQSK